MKSPHRVLILGGGFAGIYAALELEKQLGTGRDIEVTLVNRENFLLFTPMLHEVAAGDLDLTNIVNPVRKLLKRTTFIEGEAHSIDLPSRTVALGHGSDSHQHKIQYDQLILALGSTTQFFGLPGVEEHSITMKSLSDAIRLRNHLIALFEEADSESSPVTRKRLLSIVVAGAGFAGVETIASINDFLKKAIRFYPGLSPADLSMALVHPGEVILSELHAKLGTYAQTLLEERGVKVLSHARISSYDGETVRLADGNQISAHTLIWTAGTMPNSIIGTLPCITEKGRLRVTPELAVPNWEGVWALGDCALVPDLRNGKYCPPTAQHALRQGKVAAHNVIAHARGAEFKQFKYKMIGQLATIGHRAGVANIFGFNISGFPAWWLWRTIYLSKLPQLEKKVRVALDWTLDLLFSKDLCQYLDDRRQRAK